MNKEQIEQILVEYGVPFTDVLADRLLKEFTDSVAWLDGQETGFRDGYYKAHEKGKADTIEVLQEIRQEIEDFEEEVFHEPNTDYKAYASVRYCCDIIDKHIMCLSHRKVRRQRHEPTAIKSVRADQKLLQQDTMPTMHFCST